MKNLMVFVSLCLFLALSVPATAAHIGAVQNQGQFVAQNQVSVGGLSFSTQAYGTGAFSAYTVAKAPSFFSPSAGVATGSTSAVTGGTQVKFGNGFQAQGMLGSTTNNGGLYW